MILQPTLLFRSCSRLAKQHERPSTAIQPPRKSAHKPHSLMITPTRTRLYPSTGCAGSCPGAAPNPPGGLKLPTRCIVLSDTTLFDESRTIPTQSPPNHTAPEYNFPRGGGGAQQQRRHSHKKQRKVQQTKTKTQAAAALSHARRPPRLSEVGFYEVKTVTTGCIRPARV